MIVPRHQPLPKGPKEGRSIISFENRPYVTKLAMIISERERLLIISPDNLPLLISPFDNPPLDHVDHRPIRTHPPNIRG